MKFEKELVAARVRVARLDAIDGTRDRQLNTIYCALHAGLLNPECKSQFDALVMLEDLTGRSERRNQ